MAKKLTKVRPRLSRVDFFRLHDEAFFGVQFRCRDVARESPGL